MKVYLDDTRPAPPGWILVRWPEEAIALLEAGEVTDLSLDHNLGDDECGTGYDVLLCFSTPMRSSARRPSARAI